MTVDSLGNSGEHITCLWFCEDDLQVATFPRKALSRCCAMCSEFFDDEEMKEGGEWCVECYADWAQDMIVDQMIDRARGK